MLVLFLYPKNSYFQNQHPCYRYRFKHTLPFLGVQAGILRVFFLKNEFYHWALGTLAHLVYDLGCTITSETPRVFRFHYMYTILSFGDDWIPRGDDKLIKLTLSSTPARYQLGRSHGMVWFFHTAPGIVCIPGPKKGMFLREMVHRPPSKTWISTWMRRQLWGFYLPPENFKMEPTKNHPICEEKIIWTWSEPPLTFGFNMLIFQGLLWLSEYHGIFDWEGTGREKVNGWKSSEGPILDPIDYQDACHAHAILHVEEDNPIDSCWRWMNLSEICLWFLVKHGWKAILVSMSFPMVTFLFLVFNFQPMIEPSHFSLLWMTCWVIILKKVRGRHCCLFTC